MKTLSKITTLITFGFLAISCKKNPEFLYNDQNSIHFVEDSVLNFTFSKYGTNDKTLNIPIEIGGYAINKDRNVNFEIVNDSTDAVSGLHYELLENSIKLSADSFRTHIKIKLINTDPKLKNTAVSIYFRLLPNENFINGINDHQTFRINMSDILLKPKSWDGIYAGFFGSYSQVKHRAIFAVCNITDIPDTYDGGPYNYKWDAYGRAVNNYFKENYPIYDENNQIIEPWM